MADVVAKLAAVVERFLESTLTRASEEQNSNRISFSFSRLCINLFDASGNGRSFLSPDFLLRGHF
jgi:hypothetical protein